ncbi:MAG: SurA N-terminal domain-containing protein [Candidatus Omnitrophica bacterium]|nr:SurA N-terminal domain-containing protein [Candidatus Omnitrophota bacterium]
MKLSVRSAQWLLLSLLAVIIISLLCLLHTLRVKKSRQTVLAEVNGVSITVSDFNRLCSSSPDYYRDFIRENKMAFLEDLISRELLFQEAKRKKIDRLEKVRQKLQDKEKDILVEAFTKEEILKRIEASMGEVRSYYEEHKEEFVLPGTIPPQKESFDDVRERVRGLLAKSKEVEAFGNYLKKLRKKAKIRINEELLQSLQLK